jgi:signal transduction histidine kinase
VRGIVRSHHAALRVTSAVGQGTRFRVWFPLLPPPKRG